jgi:hypothetical protein
VFKAVKDSSSSIGRMIQKKINILKAIKEVIHFQIKILINLYF